MSIWKLQIFAIIYQAADFPNYSVQFRHIIAMFSDIFLYDTFAIFYYTELLKCGKIKFNGAVNIINY